MIKTNTINMVRKYLVTMFYLHNVFNKSSIIHDEVHGNKIINYPYRKTIGFYSESI